MIVVSRPLDPASYIWSTSEVLDQSLECVVHYLAAELGSKGIRVHAISPGPIKTGAGYGIDHFEELLTQAAHRSPMRRPITIGDVGNVAVYLVSDAAAALTGHIVYADAGYHVLG